MVQAVHEGEGCAVRASTVSITNLSKDTQKVWVFDSDGSAPKCLTLLPNTSDAISLKNQHAYYLYSVGFGMVNE